MEDLDFRRSVLIVDDSIINIRVVSNIVAPFGYKVYIAKTGLKALYLLTKIQPNFIIMDIQMPDMDGFECCERIKKSASRANIPIVFLSGSHDDADKNRAMRMGAKAYLTKPVMADKLLNELKGSMPWF